MSQVSVVIPAWNAAARLPTCLDALASQTMSPRDVVVVDNGSTDDTAYLARQKYPSVRLIRNEVNRGFARAANQGIHAATGDTIVLLNDDTIASPESLAELTAVLLAHPRLGAVAATLVFTNQPDRVNTAGVTIGQDLVALDALMGQSVGTLPSSPWPVFGPSGGAAAYRRAALDDVGLFDERYFAYLEDVDLAWRLRLRGWDTLASPTARVLHQHSASAGRDSPFKRYHLARNRVWCLFKNVPLALWERCWQSVVWYDWVALVAAVASRDTAWLRGRRDGLLGLSRLRSERRLVQRRRTSSIDDLAALLGPRVGPLAVWHVRRAERTTGR